MHTNRVGNLLKCKFWFMCLDRAREFANKQPRKVNASWSTHKVARGQTGSGVSRLSIRIFLILNHYTWTIIYVMAITDSLCFKWEWCIFYNIYKYKIELLGTWIPFSHYLPPWNGAYITGKWNNEITVRKRERLRPRDFRVKC